MCLIHRTCAEHTVHVVARGTRGIITRTVDHTDYQIISAVVSKLRSQGESGPCVRGKSHVFCTVINDVVVREGNPVTCAFKSVLVVCAM